MYSQEVIKLAPACTEALKKLGKANKISQQGMVEQAKESIKKKERGKYKLVYKKDTKTIIAEPRGWQWQPKVGQAFVELHHQKPHFIRDVLVKEGYDTKVWDYFGRKFGVIKHKLIPILPWEEIEEILEKARYRILIGHRIEQAYFCWILGDKTADAWGKTRQLAVMKAVIALGKEEK